MKLFLTRLNILLLIFPVIFSLSPQVLAEGVSFEATPFMDGNPASPQTNQTKETYELFDCADVTDITLDECQALLDFYANTNGDGWNNQQECSGDENDNCWLATTKIDQWYGVTVDGGHVISLVMDHNSLSGPIPETISQLPYLDEICLLSNRVTGPLPDSLGEVLMLAKLSLNDNEISGEIPSTLSNLTNLEKLSLGENQLTGNIPKELGLLPNLDRIDLHSNQLSGELPESLGQLPALTELILYDNHFTGQIPSSFVNLNTLDYFYFFATDLCERYEPEFLAWKETVLEWQGTGCVCRIFFPIIFK